MSLKPVASLLASFAVAVALVTTGFAQGKGAGKGGGQPGPSTVAVSATFRCPFTPGCAGGDRIQSDGAAYVGQSDGSGAFLESGELRIRLLAGVGRQMVLDFTEADGEASCSTGATACRRTFDFITIDEIDVHTNALDPFGDQLANGLLDIPVGASWPARLKINFPDPDGRRLLWTVRFNPTDYPGSTVVVVTRVDADTWSIDATTEDRAVLVAANTKGKFVQTAEGVFVMPFRITVRR